MSNTFFKNHSLVHNPEMPLHPLSLGSSILSLRSTFPHFLLKIFVFEFQSFFPGSRVPNFVLHSGFVILSLKNCRFPKTDGCSVLFPHSPATTPTTGKPLTNFLAVNPLCGRVCVCVGGEGREGLRVTSFCHTPHPPLPHPLDQLSGSQPLVWAGVCVWREGEGMG